MPYLACAACSMKTYSAALWSTTDHCPACGAALLRGRARTSAGRSEVVPLAAHRRFSRAAEATAARPGAVLAEGRSA